METKWNVGTVLSGESKLADLKAALLTARGIKKAEQDTFLTPPHPHALTPSDYNISADELAKAVERIQKGVADKEHILVYGDYDADGVCATAIIWEVLYNSGAKATPFIPDRFEDGYGINSDSLKRILKKHKDIKLIITVDNGIVAYDALEFATKKGIDVIVTDHHKSGKKLSKVSAIVHTTKVSGAAISYLIARTINPDYDPLDLAAIGLVADQVPLIGPARSIVKHGVAALKRPYRVGLKALYKEANIKDVSARTIGFQIAPRINAAGRMGNAMDALRLVCTHSEERSEKLALAIGATNVERQKKVDLLTVQALQSIEPDTKDPVIIVHSKDFHEGVIGLIASKLVEKYNRPAIVLSAGDDIAKASGRSVKGLDLVKLIRAHAKYIIEGGGHQMAAGFSMHAKDIEEFKKAVNSWAKDVNVENRDLKIIPIDAAIPFTLIDWDMLSLLKKFEPAGTGNPEPVFVSKEVSVTDVRHVGQGDKHLKLKFKQKTRMYTGIAFGMGERLADIKKAEKVDVAFTLNENEWNGSRDLELMVKDIKSTT